jgi:thioesterase domain-containing protein
MNLMSRNATILTLVESLAKHFEISTTGSEKIEDGSVAGSVSIRPTLVHMAGTGSLPLFVFHQAGGDLSIYQKVVDELGKTYRVEGVVSKMLNGADTDYASIAEMAEAYADLIVRERESISYRLFGFSMGGLLAMQVAASLEQRGKQVRFIGMVECDLNWYQNLNRSRVLLVKLARQLALRLKRELLFLADTPLDRLIEEAPGVIDHLINSHFAQRVPLLQDWLWRHITITDAQTRTIADSYFLRLATHISLLADVQATVPCAAPLHVWLAEDGLSSEMKQDGYAVSALVHRSILPGSHFSILDDVANCLEIERTLQTYASNPTP